MWQKRTAWSKLGAPVNFGMIAIPRRTRNFVRFFFTLSLLGPAPCWFFPRRAVTCLNFPIMAAASYSGFGQHWRALVLFFRLWPSENRRCTAVFFFMYSQFWGIELFQILVYQRSNFPISGDSQSLNNLSNGLLFLIVLGQFSLLLALTLLRTIARLCKITNWILGSWFLYFWFCV